MLSRLSLCVGLAVAAAMLSGAAAAIDAESPDQRAHRIRCWHLQHDYYALPGEIDRAVIWWRRLELERRWEETRDRRRSVCANGWGF